MVIMSISWSGCPTIPNTITYVVYPRFDTGFGNPWCCGWNSDSIVVHPDNNKDAVLHELMAK
jgi:hypothetical protein